MKLIRVRVSEHVTLKMLPEDAARFWQEQEGGPPVEPTGSPAPDLDPVHEAVERAVALPGLMSRGEMAVACRLALSARSIVELGSFKGRSLAAMMLTQPGARAWGVDCFRDLDGGRFKGATEAELRANLESLGLMPEIINSSTNEAAARFDERVDLLHIDAGHSYEECRDDLANWVPKVNPGGALCVHDYLGTNKPALQRPGVVLAVDEWRSDDWAEIEREGRMIAFRHLVADMGVLYVAFGERARQKARASIESVRARAPGLPVAVVGDAPVDGADINISHRECDPGARTAKTRMYSLSPFKRTLFLDADTELVADPEPGFALLDRVDVVLGQDLVPVFSRNNWPHLQPEEVVATREEVAPGGHHSYYNSGVVFFRRSEANRRMFARWHQEWRRWRRQDQPALLRALHAEPVRMASMRRPWNTNQRDRAELVYHAHHSARRPGAPM